jgi:hypothetical protein
VTSSLAPIIVWIPMVDGDELPAAEEASARFRELALPQFWDGSKALGGAVARSLGVSQWTAWDVYLFYPPGAEWTDAGIPAPEAALAQSGDVVVATKGTLPPAGDPSRLPKRLLGKADVVGEQSDLEALLARVAEPFAKRYPRASVK